MWPFKTKKTEPKPEPPPVPLEPKPAKVVDKYLEVGCEELRDACEVSIDLKDARVLSVERIHMGTMDERTVIGYTLPESKEIQSWYLFCSRKQHNALCEKLHETLR